MEVKAIKVVQPLGEFYIAKIKARELLKISTSSVARYDKDGNLKGNQRPLDPKRLKAIANFIMSDEMSFPTSILIAANIDRDGKIIEDIEDRWDVKQTGSTDIYNLIIPDKVTSLVIDGQHRLNAFNFAEESCKDIELVCSPEKLAVYFTRKFNFTKESPLYQKIKLAPLFSELEDLVNKDKWLLSTAAMVDGIMSLISSNPQKDRDMLAMKKTSIWSDKTRSVLTNNGKPVLRYLYLGSKDDELYSILEKYFCSVKTILWDNAANDSVILKTIGISVLFDILKNILEVDGIQESYDSYINKIRDVNYSSHYFALSGGGKTKLRRILKFKLELISESELQESDKEFLVNNIS